MEYLEIELPNGRMLTGTVVDETLGDDDNIRTIVCVNKQGKQFIVRRWIEDESQG
jgi:hypothetical protein